MKKKTKKKLIKGSLCILASFLFICIVYYETKIEKTSPLITYTSSNLAFTILKDKELINTLETKKGVLIITNNKKDMNKYIDLLYKAKIKKGIYIYNVKNDEIIIDFDKKDNIILKQKPSETYKELINYLGLYSEPYLLLDKNGKLIETKYKKIYTPIVIFINEGKIIYSRFTYGENLSDEELINEYKKGYEMLKEYKS